MQILRVIFQVLGIDDRLFLFLVSLKMAMCGRATSSNPRCFCGPVLMRNQFRVCRSSHFTWTFFVRVGMYSRCSDIIYYTDERGWTQTKWITQQKYAFLISSSRFCSQWLAGNCVFVSVKTACGRQLCLVPIKYKNNSCHFKLIPCSLWSTIQIRDGRCHIWKTHSKANQNARDFLSS